jgi:predicted GH43/DUF377 family glycosyl hydrolase
VQTLATWGGLAHFDLESPDKCLRRPYSGMFGLGVAYERGGDGNDAVFPSSQTIGADGDAINLYYGAGFPCEKKVCLGAN